MKRLTPSRLTFFALPLLWLGAQPPLVAAEGDVAIARAGLVTPDTLAVTIREGSVELGRLEKYLPRNDDQIKAESKSRTVLIRDGISVGTLSGNEHSPARYVRHNDQYQGRRASRQKLSDADAWHVSVGDRPLTVRHAYRKSRITDIAESVGKRPEVCFEHTIFLRCDAPIGKGTVRLESDDTALAPFNFRLSPDETLSDAIHVNLIGFRPDDPTKVAYLSCWMGDGGAVDYRSARLPEFSVVHDDSGETVLRGTATLRREANQPADHRGLQGRPDGTTANYAGTPTFALNFSKLDKPGTYRINVEGIGTSRPFPLRRDVYRPVMDLALEGLDAHRWGEDRELKLIDGTTMPRPAAVPKRDRSYADVPIFDTSAVYTNANFWDFAPGKRGHWKPDSPSASVVGGYMDAGDFDRNHNHWVVGYWLSDLAARKVDSDPALASRLLEASLWDVTFWSRMQNADGGVPTAVEYAEHPRVGEPSWLNTLPLYVCAPSRDGNLDFVSSASKVASVCKHMGKDDQASQLIESAEKAWQWFQAQPAEPAKNDEQKKTRLDAQSLALAELWNATGNDSYRAPLMKILAQRAPDPWSVVYPDGLLALLTVLEMSSADSALSADERERWSGAVKATLQMNYLDGSFRRSPFGALKNGWVGISFGGGSWPNVDSLALLRAWKLWKDPEYLSAAVSGIAYNLGANPNNLVYLTGMHDRSVRNVLHCDTRYSGRRSPVGIPVYGPALTSDVAAAWPLNWHLAGDQTIYPIYQQWPSYENVHEYWNWGIIMEYTVHQSHASAIYLAGMLDDR